MTSLPSRGRRAHGNRAVAVVAIVLLALAAAAAAASVQAATTLVPTLVLTPSSGEAPSVNGGLSGAGWDCGATPWTSGATVSGAGVSGSASILRGTLSGSFTVTGVPGQTRTVTVQATSACPGFVPIFLTASAMFTFNPPTPTPLPTNTPVIITRTPTPAPTFTPPPTSTPASITRTPTPEPVAATPTPASVPPSPTPAPHASPTPTEMPPPEEAPPELVPTSVASTIVFEGCTPGVKQFPVEFVPMALSGEGAEVLAMVIGAAVVVPAVQHPTQPKVFALDLPVARAGDVFRVTPKPDDADCPLNADAASTFWFPGGALLVEVVLPGFADLEGCLLGNKSPCEHPVVKGAFVRQDGPLRVDSGTGMAEGAWDTKLTYYHGGLHGRVQRFRWKASAPAGATGVLQASLLPFPKKGEDDYLKPPGLVASWEVSCLNCEFTADLTVLAPPKTKAKKTFAKKAADTVLSPLKSVFDAAAKAVGLKKKKPPTASPAGPGKLSDSLVSDYLVGGQVNHLLQPTTYYFRVVPLQDEKPAGPPTNPVLMQQVPKPEPIKIVAPTPTPPPAPSAYEVKIVSYHGIIPPKVSNKPCYIVTEEAWPAKPHGFTYTTNKSQAISGLSSVKPGQLICKPEPKEKSLFDKIVNWATSAVDWASAAWKELKGFAVDVILKYTPFGLQCTALEATGALPKGSCQTAFAIALDAALVSLGIPPDIPNFDQLMNEGIEYLAVQAASQVAIPPEVVKAATQQGGPLAGWALDEAEAKLRAEMEAQIKANLKDAVKQVQLSYAKSVSWVPDGIPVTPDDYQPPGATIRVTRKPGVPGGEKGCTVSVRDYLKLDATILNSPPPAWAGTIAGLPTPLSPLTLYDFFVNETDLSGQGFPGVANKKFYVPPLSPGESLLIPMTFKPNYYKNGWHPLGLISTSTYITVWHFMHEFGTLHLAAEGCGSDQLVVPAKAAVLGAEVVGP